MVRIVSVIRKHHEKQTFTSNVSLLYVVQGSNNVINVGSFGPRQAAASVSRIML